MSSAQDDVKDVNAVPDDVKEKHAAQDGVRNLGDSFPKIARLPDKIAVKQSAPYANDWLEFDYQGHSFMSTHSDWPAFGNSEMSVECWVWRDFNGQWEQVLNVFVYGVYNGELIFSPETGALQFQGTANNKYNGKPVVSLDLNAAMN